eukprot:gnl/MRDRNA2_/MRDRNA2_35819_c0_seq1.p1 gnl/MRDRNA2_/MRDRNA2_35819_c0~~gnl/MRDRNA2_/MRDRNA2_35819_c0_seq1.p1  ORF type:complete len:295 (+),score=37.78 gnl/MRDRNA2_/MRDRNA2_35819_c0_seq1:57-941(+)
MGAEGAPVTLHVYDVGRSPHIQKLNNVLSFFNTGAFHTAVEVYGNEWSFGGHDMQGRTGVCRHEPRACQQHIYREALPMGRTKLTESEVEELIERKRKEWCGTDYDMLGNNCTHFSNQLCLELSVGPVPVRLRNLAELGVHFEPIVTFVTFEFEKYAEDVRPWGELVAVKIAMPGADWVPRMKSNVVHFYANYVIVSVVVLLLGSFDFSHPMRPCAVIGTFVAWVIFLLYGGKDLDWSPRVLGFEITEQIRTNLMLLGSAALIFSVLAQIVFLCMLLVFAHALVAHQGNYSHKD